MRTRHDREQGPRYGAARHADRADNTCHSGIGLGASLARSATLALGIALGCGSKPAIEAVSRGSNGAAIPSLATGAAPSRLDRIGRADFNRRAVELAQPLFWRSDANGDGVLAPDELVVTWSHTPRERAEFVDARQQFTPSFLALYERLLAPDDPLGPADELRRRAAVRRELAQGRPTLLESDFAHASAGEKALARHVQRAARQIEIIYAKQRGSYGLDARIPADDPASAALFFRNQGPACRAPKTEHDPDCHALPERVRPLVGLYPAAIQTDRGICALLEQQANAAALLGHFATVVAGDIPNTFRAVPYSLAYRDEMQAVARELDAAAAALEDGEAALAAYLTAAARAFRDDDWEAANRAWRALSGRSKYYLRIGPDEVGADPCGWKAQFALTFARIDPGSLDWRRRLEPIKQAIEDDLAALAGPPYRARQVGFELPDFIEVILSAGDARLPLGAIGGQSLPNWGPVAERGGRTVVMTNLQTSADFLEARDQQMAAVYCPQILGKVARERALLVLGTVLHEATHSLGPTHEYLLQGKVDSAIFGGGRAGLLEELKARSAELYLPELLVDRGLLGREEADGAHLRDLASSIAVLAEGVYDAAGKPKAAGQVSSIELGTLRASGILVWRPDQLAGNGSDRGCLDVQLERWRPALTELMRQALQIKARGDRQAAQALVARWVDTDDDWKALRTELGTRWLRTSKASVVYAIGGT